jgi:glycosyltransferase involved in cell wall biosynthesis
VFFEHADVSAAGVERSRAYDLVIAGSTWNADALRARGIEQTRLVFQGVDTSLFFPAEPSGLLSDRFVVFSGGKLEYRKGQDIVVAAFRAFRERHPEALLVVAWHNYWSEKMAGLDRTGNVVGLPPLNEQGYPRVADWLRANGLPDDAFLDLGALPNPLMPNLLREANVALFPNRCEGGTNLVAMECFACGVPTILSANTGHLDLIAEDRCYPLRSSRRVASRPTRDNYDGWGEPTVEEVVETLERVYTNRDEARRRGDAALRFIRDWKWENQTRRLLEALEPYL